MFSRLRFFGLAMVVVLLLAMVLTVRRHYEWIHENCIVPLTLPGADDPVVKGLLSDMVLVKGGVFTMGATVADNPYCDEMPPHEVYVASFSLCRHEVSQAEWKALMGDNPSIDKGDDLPATCISWVDCDLFIRRLNRVTGRHFRFPTEQEWEYAAKKGMEGMPQRTPADTLEWTLDVGGGRTHPVGKLSPNALGLCDMGGNVSEWCDTTKLAYSDTLYRVYERRKAVRGGNYSSDPWHARPSFRMSEDLLVKSPVIGLRLAE